MCNVTSKWLLFSNGNCNQIPGCCNCETWHSSHTFTCNWESLLHRNHFTSEHSKFLAFSWGPQHSQRAHLSLRLQYQLWLSLISQLLINFCIFGLVASREIIYTRSWTLSEHPSYRIWWYLSYFCLPTISLNCSKGCPNNSYPNQLLGSFYFAIIETTNC